MDRRQVVFINQATGYLTIDIINAFVESKQFAKVALIAGSIRVQDIPLDPSVKWSKISLYDRGTPRKKVLSWLKGTLQVFFLLMTRYRRHEVFYITIPPFAYLLSLVLPNRFSVLVFDVYPDVLQIYNVKPKQLLYRIWTRWNRILFKKAHRLFTVGSGMAKLLSQYTSAEKIMVIPNWSGLTSVQEIAKGDNLFVQENGLAGKFVVQYAGNIGYTHNVEVLVDIAQLMAHHEDVFFLIIGRGEKFKTIQDMVEERQLLNCRLLPFQPDDLLNSTLSAADLGVVLLDDKTAHVSVPSKIYNLQAVGVPILGIVDTASELAMHVSKHNNGSCFTPADKKGIMDFILQLKVDERKHSSLRANSRMAAKAYTSLNAREYVRTYLNSEGSRAEKLSDLKVAG